ncbi:hypothetical protein GCM10027589_05490 [Actinocorallia lasiicapitis]
MFGLYVRFTCKDEQSAAAFDELVAETLELIKDREPGTLLYVPHAIEGEPLVRAFYELYADRAAFDAHEEQEHVKRFLGARGEFLDAVHVDWLSSVDGKGIPE